MNGSYANGYGTTNGNGFGGDYLTQGRYGNDDVQSFRRPSLEVPEPRVGGYGGLGGVDTLDGSLTERPITRPTDLERRRANERSTDRAHGTSRSGSRPRGARAGQQIEDVLQYINHNWKFMTQDECVPVQVALQLLDESSLGLANRYDEFQDAQQQLQNALKAIVNEHHQGFNSSIGTFHQIQASIQSSYHRVRVLKDSLVKAKSNLSTAKPEITSLAKSSEDYANMLDVLNIIEQIQRIPEQVEARISDKHFISAVDLLKEALGLISRPDMENVGALNDMKIYLSNQEHSLTDILTEELHNHLYLKAPYCEDRWIPYAQSYEANVSNGSTVLPVTELRQMFIFLGQLDSSLQLNDDSSRNPEADSFQYIYMIVEALNKLGHLETAVQSLEQRLPVELFKVVEKTNSDVQQRHPSSLVVSANSVKANLELPSGNDPGSSVLNDLLTTLYAKFEAIAEAHRVLNDVVAGVSRRSGLNTARLTRGFKELWKLYQSEMRTLLHSYLSDDGEAGQRGEGLAGNANIFRYQRDRSKKCTFKMDWVNPATAEHKPEHDDVVATFQKFVPGLVSFSQTQTASAGNVHHDSSAAGHKLLVGPSVFNIESLLPTSIIFLTRLKEIIPHDSDILVSTLSSFLSDFLINVFHPQLEETIVELCSQSFLQADAFLVDPNWIQHSQKPVFKGAIRFFKVVSSFSKMLDDLSHDQLFSQLIITQMNTYCDKCSAWYQVLVTRAQTNATGSRLKAAASLAESNDLAELMAEVWEDPANPQSVFERESSLLISAAYSQSPEESDSISDPKSQASLCLLYSSMTWLSAKLAQLRFISDRATDSSDMEVSDRPQLKRGLTKTFDAIKEDNRAARLPLTEQTASMFDGVVAAFRELAATALRTLRIEFRCQILRGLGASFKGVFVYLEAFDAPHERVLQLVASLLEMNQEYAKYLQTREHKFITNHTAYFVDSVLTNAFTTNVTSMNQLGSVYLQLNADVLYHNLLNIDVQGDLPRTFAILRLFGNGPAAVVAASHQRVAGLTNDQLRKVLALQYSVALQGTSREQAITADKDMQERLSQFSAV